jgi:succinate dehydrogenase / fumarate reductase flavoprotein subunit
MEVGPTCHYVMGGVKVDPDTAAATLPGLFAAGECAAGMHGSNRLGGNSLGDLLVFGRRAGKYAAEYAAGIPAGARPTADDAQVTEISAAALAPFDRAAAAAGTSPADRLENAYQVQLDLQDTMQSLVGIIRTESELRGALKEIEGLRERAGRVAVEGHRQYNPGWHLAIDLNSLLTVAECIATAALARKESRGGHTRDDYPKPDPEFGKVNHVLRLRDGRIELAAEQLPQLPTELAKLFDAPARQRDKTHDKAADTTPGGDEMRAPAPADPTVTHKEGA